LVLYRAGWNLAAEFYFDFAVQLNGGLEKLNAQGNA
jgi:hypothetical protein